MKKYFGMRVLMAIPTILGVFLAVFLIIRMVPGDPASVMLGKTATPEEIPFFYRECPTSVIWIWLLSSTSSWRKVRKGR